MMWYSNRYHMLLYTIHLWTIENSKPKHDISIHGLKMERKKFICLCCSFPSYFPVSACIFLPTSGKFSTKKECGKIEWRFGRKITKNVLHDNWIDFKNIGFVEISTQKNFTSKKLKINSYFSDYERFYFRSLAKCHIFINSRMFIAYGFPNLVFEYFISCRKLRIILSLSFQNIRS